MITRSPILLAVAAQAMASRSAAVVAVAPRRVLAPGEDDGMPFVHHAGYWSHLEPRCNESSWPFARNASLVSVERQLHRLKLLDERGHAGDLLLLYDSEGATVRIGIVLAVMKRIDLPGGVVTSECDVLWGSQGGAPVPAATRALTQVDSSRGDRFAPWYLMTDRRRDVARSAA